VGDLSCEIGSAQTEGSRSRGVVGERQNERERERKKERYEDDVRLNLDQAVFQ
jgi:hypothetical protein